MKTSEFERNFRLEEKHWWFVNRRRLVCEAIRRHGGRRGVPRILDVGCGTGFMAGELGRLGDVTGVDCSPEALEFCRRRGLTRCLAGRAESLEFGEGYFSAVTALDVLEHIEDDGLALAEFRRVLAVDGLLFITVPAHRFLWSGHDEALHHRRRYNSRDLREKVEAAGFRVVRMTHFVSLLFPAIALIRLSARLFRRQPRSDLSDTRGLLNGFLSAICFLERALLGLINLPFGVSLFCIARPA